jgi:hypothetical protein
VSPILPADAAPLRADDPMSVVLKYIDAFNKGDERGMAATFAPHSSILDSMAPHLWLGPTANQDWYWDVLTDRKQQGTSEYRITLDDPRHVDVTGDTAYVVVPATMTFKVQERSITQSGAIFIVALRKISQRWRIAAWAWAKGQVA